MEGLVLFFFFGLVMALTALWIYALVDIVRSDFQGDSDKVIWLLLVVLIPFVGTVLYFAIGQNQKLSHPPNDLV